MVNMFNSFGSKYKGVLVSHGTLNPVHLWDAFFPLIQTRKGYTKLDWVKQGKKLRQELEDLEWCPHEEYNTPEIQDRIEYLESELNEIVEEALDFLHYLAPHGCYFGVTEGDGSDFGFWKNGSL